MYIYWCNQIVADFRGIYLFEIRLDGRVIVYAHLRTEVTDCLSCFIPGWSLLIIAILSFLCIVQISFENFRSVPPFLRDDASDDDQSREELYSGDEDPRPQITVSRGHRRSKGVPAGAATKHDPVVCGRRNVKNMEKFPPAFPAGDMNDESQDYRLPNSVFNTLKLHSQKEEKHVRSSV